MEVFIKQFIAQEILKESPAAPSWSSLVFRWGKMIIAVLEDKKNWILTEELSSQAAFQHLEPHLDTVQSGAWLRSSFWEM